MMTGTPGTPRPHLTSDLAAELANDKAEFNARAQGLGSLQTHTAGSQIPNQLRELSDNMSSAEDAVSFLCERLSGVSVPVPEQAAGGSMPPGVAVSAMPAMSPIAIELSQINMRIYELAKRVNAMTQALDF